MCGIAGTLRLDGGTADPRLVARMCAAIEHRGPDARGVHADGPAGLGIQRLRVIDLQTGDQPVFNEDGSVAVVLNGEIYNYRELRERLRRNGHVLATRGDTEVIAHLYEELGPACVLELQGMFAFALWDGRRRRLMIARDRVGKKPLLYALRADALSWGSEMSAVLQDSEVPREVDHAALDAYLAYGYVPAPASAFRAVRKLPPAHMMVVQDGNVTIERYWRLDYGRKEPVTDLAELKERIRAAIRAATRRRMIADVPLGAFLSGGIDSSAVVAAMAEASSQPVRTFSIGFDHGAFDELPHARRIARLFGTEHQEFTVRADAIEVVPRIVRHHGEPFADSSAIPSFYLAALTRRHVTVALNGDGGDESFAGYTRYVANGVAARLDRVPVPLRRAAAAAGRRLPATGEISSPLNRARRLSSALDVPPADRYARYVSWFDAAQRRALLSDDFLAEVGDADAGDVIRGRWAAASGEAVLDRMLEVDVGTYLPDDLIAKIDIATMAHALEARSPLLDPELMQLAASIPASLKVRGGQKKWILREALRGWLPDEILDRPKQGFSVPVTHWLRHELRDQVREVLLDRDARERGWFREGEVARLLDRHAAGVDDDARRIWALYMLELWQREVADAPAGPMSLKAAA